MYPHVSSLFFFFNDTATTEIYTLSLHDALPICRRRIHRLRAGTASTRHRLRPCLCQDRKSTRLNSSHSQISYAVFCLKKKKIMRPHISASLHLRTHFSSSTSAMPLYVAIMVSF